jgi:hypothetical protein
MLGNFKWEMWCMTNEENPSKPPQAVRVDDLEEDYDDYATTKKKKPRSKPSGRKQPVDKLARGKKKCAHCGTMLATATRTCSGCGADVRPAHRR